MLKLLASSNLNIWHDDPRKWKRLTNEYSRKQRDSGQPSTKRREVIPVLNEKSIFDAALRSIGYCLKTVKEQ
jgi:hypothetical protein